MEEEKTGYPHIDKPWMKYYDLKSENIELPEMSIYQFAKYLNKDNGDKVAIDIRNSSNDFKKGVQITYNEFFKNTEEMAKASKILGIKTDEIVPIILPNTVHARNFIYSNSILGATSYPISPLLAVNELERIIKENDIKNVVVDEQLYYKFKNAIDNSSLDSVVFLNGTEILPNNVDSLKSLRESIKNGSIPRGEKFISWDEYIKLANLNKGDVTPYYKKNHIAAIIGTSGTTGTSKGVCLSDDNINAAAIEYRDGKCFEGSFLDILLPSIGYGLSMIHYQMSNGHYVYLIPELVFDKIVTLVQETKPNCFPGGPVHFITLSNSEEFKNGNLHKMGCTVCGGATLPNATEKKLNKVDDNYMENGVFNDNIVARQGYGLSENVATCSYSKRGAYKFGSIGIPLPYITVGIFEPGTDKPLKYNESGEICITGPTVMQGYLNNKTETDNVIKIHNDGNRWIHTKDIGYIDEDGHLFHEERIKNMFMRTGFNVHPTKIAEFIDTLPNVKESHVIGFDHPAEQCVPVAFIVLDDKTDKSSTEIIEDIKEQCYKNLEETSIPYDYIIVPELPRNAGGKIDSIKIKANCGIDYMKESKSLKKVKE